MGLPTESVASLNETGLIHLTVNVLLKCFMG